MHVSKDILGPRFSWTLSESEERTEFVEMYGGDWARIVEERGEDCILRETERERLTIGRAIDLVGANGAATAQLAYAPALRGLKSALVRALAARGLRLAA